MAVVVEEEAAATRLWWEGCLPFRTPSFATAIGLSSSSSSWRCVWVPRGEKGGEGGHWGAPSCVPHPSLRVCLADANAHACGVKGPAAVVVVVVVHTKKAVKKEEIKHHRHKAVGGMVGGWWCGIESAMGPRKEEEEEEWQCAFTWR